MEGDHRRRGDAGPRDYAEGRGGRGAGRCGGGGHRDAGRARSHQEGQEGRGRGREGREERREETERGQEEVIAAVKLVVGLGNPGAQYKGTRHNAGFAVIDEIARRASVGFESAPAEAVIAKWRRPDGGALLAKPLTFMNLSGQAGGEISRDFKIE